MFRLSTQFYSKTPNTSVKLLASDDIKHTLALLFNHLTLKYYSSFDLNTPYMSLQIESSGNK